MYCRSCGKTSPTSLKIMATITWSSFPPHGVQDDVNSSCSILFSVNTSGPPLYKYGFGRTRCCWRTSTFLVFQDKSISLRGLNSTLEKKIKNREIRREKLKNISNFEKESKNRDENIIYVFFIIFFETIKNREMIVNTHAKSDLPVFIDFEVCPSLKGEIICEDRNAFVLWTRLRRGSASTTKFLSAMRNRCPAIFSGFVLIFKYFSKI